MAVLYVDFAPKSGKGTALPPPPPLGTEHDTFASLSSSLHNASMQDAVTSLPLGDLYDTHLELTRGCPRETAPAVLLNSAVICFASCASWPNSLVREDQMEVSPLSRAVMLPRGSTAIHFITKWPSLSPPSPTRRPVGSPYGLLSLTGGRRAYHVPHADPNGLGVRAQHIVNRFKVGNSSARAHHIVNTWVGFRAERTAG